MTDQETPLERARRLIIEDQERVFALIRRDKQDRIRDRDRKRAQLEVADGRFADLAESVEDPTPEWLEKGDVRTFIPKQPKGTTKVIRSVRRVNTPRVIQMLNEGSITGDQAVVCTWYRTQWEQAGLSGRVKSNHISLTGNTGGGGGMGQAPMALHEREAEARLAYRAARDALTPFYVKFFEAVVIHDSGVGRAAKLAKCRYDRALKRFRETAQELVEHCERVKAIIPNVGECDDD